MSSQSHQFTSIAEARAHYLAVGVPEANIEPIITSLLQSGGIANPAAAQENKPAPEDSQPGGNNQESDMETAQSENILIFQP